MKYFIWGFIFSIILIVAGGAFFTLSGYYNISAQQPHYQITEKLIDIFKRKAIERHSSVIKKPQTPSTMGPDTGVAHYHTSCRKCHGAPGFYRTEFADGLYPAPPDLTIGYVQEQYNSSELYWIIAYGLKMTGMPGFGETHSEEALQAIVNLVEGLPKLNEDNYNQLIEGQHNHHE